MAALCSHLYDHKRLFAFPKGDIFMKLRYISPTGIDDIISSC
jgi:hypothetical protein